MRSSPAFEVFSAVVDLDPAARAAAVERRCAGDHALRVEVESLLAASARTPGGFLDETPLGGAVAEATAEASGDRTGTTIGAYRIIRELGAGGMGSVYLAERTGADFEQLVAVKLIRRGMDTADILARFRQERRVLAGLEHPNIARLLDGGSTDDGLPYLVMEYVDGVPIDRHGAERGLSIAERLHLFRTACDAVQHAHRNLVVHRDLKPGNILVARDEEGIDRVKLLDFGIAKVLDPSESTTGVTATVTSTRRLTPACASPEQVRGGAVTTATDVYSLGVVLYELLTGNRPFDGATVDELETAMCEAPPVRPDLPADLAQIVLMALRKEADRRYVSVEQLSDDVQRYLDGRPVLAQPDTLAYRVRRFVARNRGAVAAATLTVVVVLGAAVVSTTMYLRAERERQVVSETSDFLESLLGSIDSATARGRASLLREILDDAAVRLDRELGSNPRVARRLHLTIGRTYAAIADYETALAHLDRAVTLARAGSGADLEALGDALHARGAALNEVGRYDEARAVLDEALAVRAQSSVEARAITMTALGQNAQLRGAYGESAALLEEAVGLLRSGADVDPAALARALLVLSVVQADQNRGAEAVSTATEALAICRERFGPAHPTTGDAWHAMGWALLRAERGEEAETPFRRSLEIVRATVGPDHPDVATAVNHLASTLQAMGRFEEAEPLFVEALRIFRANFGDEHRDVGTALNNLAYLYGLTDRFDEAFVRYGEAIDVYRRTLGPNHVFVLILLKNVLELAERQGDILGVPEHVAALRALDRSALPPDTLPLLDNVDGAILLAEGRLEDAEAILLASYGQLCDLHAPDSKQVRLAKSRLTRLYRRLGRSDEG